MKYFAETTHSFIVRLWLEPSELTEARKGSQEEWRGMIEHVASGEKRYFREMDVMVSFIAGYLDCWEECLRKPAT